MAAPQASVTVLRETMRVHEECGGNQVKTAARLNITRGALQHRINEARRRRISHKDLKDFEIQDLPSYQSPVEEIIQRRCKEFDRKATAQAARRLINVKVKLDGPIGILHEGDPHLDDPGTNMPLILEHAEIIDRTPGLFAACVGDFINNWRGKLAALHASQGTTQIEALKLLEWYIKRHRWLYLIGGNHDVWHGDGDPVMWFRSDSIYEWHGCRINLRFPNGRDCRIHARHDFPGSSMYNPAHGATKAAKFSGEDHIYINGHKHHWAYVSQENPIKDIVWHAIQLGAYKQIDDFAHKLNFDSCRYGAAAVTIINPEATTASEFVTVFWNVEQAADFLTFLRKRAGV